MTTRNDIERWFEACSLFDRKAYVESLWTFEECHDYSYIYFDMGMVYSAMADQEKTTKHRSKKRRAKRRLKYTIKALECFLKSVEKDKYLVIGYIQCGITNIMLHKYREILKPDIEPLDAAIYDFNRALEAMKSRTMVDYEILGLKHIVYRWEILYNCALCHFYKGDTRAGRKVLKEASDAYTAQPQQTELKIAPIARKAERGLISQIVRLELKLQHRRNNYSECKEIEDQLAHLRQKCREEREGRHDAEQVEHGEDFIEKAFYSDGKDCPFMGVPSNGLFRPGKNKLQFLERANFLGGNKLLLPVKPE